MKEIISTLESELQLHFNARIASEQKAYMREQFDYHGIKAPLRREIFKPFFVKDFLPDKKELAKIVKVLWNKPQRDFHYFSMELVQKYTRQFQKKDIELLEFMVTNKSWWDTIDFIAPKLIGEYFKMYPEMRDPCVKKWIASGNIWLQRSCILFQLKYKDEIDLDFLRHVVCSLKGSKEFFINKAIGWILREYSKRNPQWVIDFTEKHKLSPLSHREALKLLKLPAN